MTYVFCGWGVVAASFSFIADAVECMSFFIPLYPFLSVICVVKPCALTTVLFALPFFH